jgi:Arc/MetJ-type ribon-helix-helix transcriptional regulator
LLLNFDIHIIGAMYEVILQGPNGRLSYLYANQSDAINAGSQLLHKSPEWTRIRVLDRTAQRVLWDARRSLKDGDASDRDELEDLEN